MSAMSTVQPRGMFAPGDINYHLAEAVRWLIRHEDQQQAHVAIAAGMSPEDLSELMTGQDVFYVEDMLKLAESLGTDPGALLRLAYAFRDGDEPESALDR